MAKTQSTTDGTVLYWCPGCDHAHGLNVDRSKPGPCWGWDGDTEAPTFSPSVLVHTGPNMTTVCHSFVRDGRAEFLGDSTHAMAGQTVDLPEWPYG